MNSADLITILGNISHSLAPLQKLISGGAYLLGVSFFFSAMLKLLAIGNSRIGSPSQEKMYAPLMHILIGSLLIYLPSALDFAANTAFGVGNILTYSTYSSGNTSNLIKLFIQTAGILWFVRGCVLVVHASEPGTGHGLKGLAFIISGILAANFDNTVSLLTSGMGHLATWTIAVKNSQGY
jgi:hypothetical protein